MKKKLAVVIAFSMFGASCAAKADLPAGGGKPTGVSSAWKELCEKAPSLTANVRTALLAGKDLKKKSFRLIDARYRPVMKRSSKGYGQTLAGIFFTGFFKSKTIKQVAAFVEKISNHAETFHRKNKSLLAEAEKIERTTKVLYELLDGMDAAALKSLKCVKFTGTGGDELSFSLRTLSRAVADGEKAEAVAWAGEAYGAAARLADILRWVDLQSEWLMDLTAVAESFKPYFDNTDAILTKEIGGWKIFMFGRCPGCMSIMTLCAKDVLMVEYLLVDFYTVSAKDATAMGKGGGDKALLAVTPARRDACRKILNALPERSRPTFRKILRSDYELSAFGSNIWRYEDEGKLDNLIGSLKRHVANYPAPTVGTMMEIIHISQGAWGATKSAEDRYHPKIIEWAGEVKGKPRAALRTAHGFAHKFYSRGGYKGRVWTLTDAFKVGKLDCIRICQMIASVYADAGYVGLHPIRVGHGSVRQKLVAASGHTLLSAKFGDRDFCVEGLGAPGLGGPFATRYKGRHDVLSCSRGYRALCGWVAGEIYFPQGPIGPVQLRIPYCGIERKGFGPTGKPASLPAPATRPRRRTDGG